MQDNINLESRKKRMSSLFSGKNNLRDEGLVKVCAINEKSINKLQNAVMYYVWDCLISSNPDLDIKIDRNFYKNYEEVIKELPNITPNGLLVPKKENLLSFNKLQKIIYQEFEKNNLNNKIDKVQFPVNIRIQSGSFGGDKRPRSSEKKHTDIWAGDPSGAIIVFLHIAGDYENIGINFFEPSNFPKELLNTLDDYDKGNSKIGKLKKLDVKYDDSGWIFADPFIIHQTYKNVNSIRISLDFRFIPKEKIDSDTYEDENRKPYFISPSLWSKYGDSKILASKQTLLGDYKKNNFTRSYPVEIFCKDILNNSKKNILSNTKFIGKNYILDKFDLSTIEFDELFGKDFELLEYEILHDEDRDNVIKSILEKINLKSLRVSGENNNEVWEKGWGEILEEISEKFHPDKIMPQYFDHHNIMRFDGHYIKAISSNFVYKYDQIIRKIIIKKYINTKKLIEIGCGTGSGTLLAANLLSTDIELTASDWATKSQLIVDKISEYTKRPIKSVQFNMLDLKGWDELGVDKDSTIISFHALEQLGDNYKLLLNKLASQKIKCIHLEPIVELYNNENLYDELAIIYHNKRNYLGSYLSEIKRLQKHGKAKIIKEQRISFGDRYHEAYSLIIWKGV
tara:strand:+ start:5165 stop:7036 length:1872 start_codon:yes stop_codon:yes gene_type:complete